MQSPTVKAVPRESCDTKGVSAGLIKLPVLEDKMQLLNRTNAAYAPTLRQNTEENSYNVCGQATVKSTISESILLDKAPDAGSRDAPLDTRTHPYHNTCSSAR